MFEFRPCAGLANRLRACASAIAAVEAHAAATGCAPALRIWWLQEPAILMAPFSDLFDASALPPWVEVREGQPTGQQLLLKTEADWEAYAALALPLRPTLKSYYAFYGEGTAPWVTALRAFRPRGHLATQVEAALAPAKASGAPVIGIHIRRTDHQRSIAASPTGEFMEMIRAQLEENPKTRFFLATDDARERHALFQAFGTERFITLTNNFHRFDAAAATDALRDFLALSQCAEIWGSFASSFSEVAAAYGGRTLRTVQVSK